MTRATTDEKLSERSLPDNGDDATTAAVPPISASMAPKGRRAPSNRSSRRKTSGPPELAPQGEVLADKSPAPADRPPAPADTEQGPASPEASPDVEAAVVEAEDPAAAVEPAMASDPSPAGQPEAQPLNGQPSPSARGSGANRVTSPLAEGVQRAPQSSIRGRIDLVSADQGIVGWVFNLDEPALRLKVQLIAGNTVLAETEVNQFRSDLGNTLDPEFMPGFRFGPETFYNCFRVPPDQRGQRLMIRVTGTAFGLGGTAMPTVTEALELAEDVARRAEAATRTGQFSDLASDLMRLRSEAEPLCRIPFRPLPGAERGFIEAICPLSDDLVIISGWVMEGEPLNFCGVIVDGQKYPAGIFVATYPRDDLPEGALAFFGVASTRWRPSGPAADFFLYRGFETPVFLRSVKPLHALSEQDALARLNELRAQSDDRRLRQIERLIELSGNWVPSGKSIAQGGVALSIDRAIVLEDFGVFVEGWLLSPYKRIEDVIMKLGDNLLHLDGASRYSKPRPDLQAAFPRMDDLFDQAGFVGIFRGQVSDGDLFNPMLKIVFADGSSVVQVLDASIFRSCLDSRPLAQVAMLYPSLPVESFFDQFVAAFRRQVLTLSRRADPLIVQKARRLVAVALPQEPSDVLLVLEELADEMGSLASDVGVALIAGPSHDRPRVLGLANDLRFRLRRPVSLFRVANTSFALYSLTAILQQLECDWFTYIGPDMLPTSWGWSCIESAHAEEDRTLQFFASEDALEGHPLEGASVDCFAWSAQAFREWMLGAPAFLNGTYEDNGLAELEDHVLHKGAVRRLRSQPSSMVIETFNEAVRRRYVVSRPRYA
ncbi:hypothetical protein [Chelatococcus asaccharovorans]|uniref:Uncharacterized protein n=1 Tax=Chelatococcus asaccharovorans TaxID=28210 RepID=A0A2V3TUU9_9HYPH|nr:hypothetical protein [Chelatococcus asaccharovorans]MBS7704935.1 hypothetical protein [Chelatococcus asaccharovorans]PXW51849.1 hypothetical protein C7450_1184 [Chelatococcus asaccharovorans]